MTANEIKSIDDDAFLGLPELEELVIRENHISQLPGLPKTMTLIDGSHNDIGSKGLHHEAFKVHTANLTCPFMSNQQKYYHITVVTDLNSSCFAGNAKPAVPVPHRQSHRLHPSASTREPAITTPTGTLVTSRLGTKVKGTF